MKKLVVLILSVVMFIIQIGFDVNAETFVPTRVINLVYDDSGSMIRTNGTYVDTWCQAKYAMEVFAAMLGEKDTLNIYYMSDYVSGTSARPKVSLTGSKDANVTAQNVNTIHNLVTNCSDTPFNAVKKAYSDLKGINADERWLVVLTDGEFNGTSNSEVESYFNNCTAESAVNIMMLSMGPNAAEITPNPDKGIYFEKAESTTDILGKLTGICNRIFQSNALPIDEAAYTTSFSVPMSQLIVFAQGQNVSIGSITKSDGTEIAPSSNVNVSYSSVATTNTGYPSDKIIIANNLMGYVAAYDSSFEPGEYKFNVTGAENIQVYYKPNVSVAAYLYDGEKEVTAEENLVAGDYKLEFGFVNAVTGEKIIDTALLGNIEYDAVINNKTNDGNETTVSAKSGDNISIKEGTINIDVNAKFLEYNTVNTKLSYNIYALNDLIFAFENKPTYTLNKDGFANSDEPMVLTVQINDGTETKSLTEEQWELLGIPEITADDTLGEFKIEKTEELGKYFVYPALKENDPMKTGTGNIDLTVSGSFKQGLSVASGELSDTIVVESTISTFERVVDWLKDNWVKLTVSLIIFFLILGYIPPFKKYLPRKIKKRPLIECSAERIGLRDTENHGKYKKNLLSTLVPYKAEVGFVTFSPSPNKKTAKLKAAGSNSMYITNTRAFAGKEEFSFNGMSIEKDRTKPYKINGGSTISLRTQEYTYTCYLNR